MTLLRLMVITVLLFPAGCESTVYLPGPNQPRPSGGFTRHALWTPPAGSAPDRMKLVGTEDPDALGGTLTIYRTLWHSPLTYDETWLVCLQQIGYGGFDRWLVCVYDRNLEMMQLGEVTTNGTATPVGIVEVRPTGPQLPNERNGKWQLALVSCNFAGSDYDLHGKTIRGGDHELGLVTTLVHWDHDWDELRYGYGNLSPRELDSIAYRPAEAGLAVTEHGKLLFDGQPAPPLPELWLDIEE